MCVQSQQSIPEYRMWLGSAYFDESLDADIEERCFTVAGFMGPPEPLLLLDMVWSDNLTNWKMSRFKASELELGFGCFAQYRDDPLDLTKPLSQREKDLIREIKTSFVDIICEHCSKDGISGVGATLVLRDLHLFHNQEPDLAQRLPNAYTICGDLMLLEAGNAMALSNERRSAQPRGIMQPVFDIQAEYGPRFLEGFPDFVKKNPLSSKFLKPPMFEPEEKYKCLQAADLLAYESRKLLINSLYDKDRLERVAMTRLRDHVDRIYQLDYENLKMIAESQRNDFIPIEPKINNRQ